MKKFIFLLLLQLVCVNVFAQKHAISFSQKNIMASNTDDQAFLKSKNYFQNLLFNERNAILPKLKMTEQYMIGWCYEHGKAGSCTESCVFSYNTWTGVLCSTHGREEEKDVQSYEQAYYWYMKSAKQGFADAMCALGNLYRNGNGVEQDDSQSFYWYKKAAEKGNYTAQYYVGESYERGKGVEQNNNEAFNWYLTAAKKNTEAQYKVGVCYDEGIGVAQNSSKAKKYWKKAAKDGNYFAQKALDEYKKK